MASTVADYFEALEARAEEHGRALPVSKAERPDWQGVGFQLAGENIVVPTDEIVEVMMTPSVTPIPGVKQHLLGIAHSRGRIFPVLSLEAYLHIPPALGDRYSRLILVQLDDGFIGIRGANVSGVKRFFAADMIDAQQVDVTVLQPFVQGQFFIDGLVWHVLSIKEILQNSEVFDFEHRIAQ